MRFTLSVDETCGLFILPLGRIKCIFTHGNKKYGHLLNKYCICHQHFTGEWIFLACLLSDYGRIVLLFNNTVYSVKCEWKLCGLFRVNIFKGSILTYCCPVSMLTSSLTDHESYISLDENSMKQSPINLRQQAMWGINKPFSVCFGLPWWPRR